MQFKRRIDVYFQGNDVKPYLVTAERLGPTTRDWIFHIESAYAGGPSRDTRPFTGSLDALFNETAWLIGNWHPDATRKDVRRTPNLNADGTINWTNITFSEDMVALIARRGGGKNGIESVRESIESDDEPELCRLFGGKAEALAILTNCAKAIGDAA